MQTSGWPDWCCPTDLTPLLPHERGLRCPHGETFVVIKGIPRFVSGANYADNFGAQWNRHRLTQLDSYTGMPLTQDRLLRCLGEDLWKTLAGRQVLECGCGAGRFTEILLGRGAMVTSVDLSTAVEANADNFPLGPAHRIAQADILHLPFQPRQFDVVLCLGVIQHTPQPERTIQALYEHVKPGGTLAIDHYTFTFSRITSPKPLLRACLKRVSPLTATKVIQRLGNVFLPLHRRARNHYPAWFLLSRISPMTTYYRMYPDLPENLQRDWALLDTHDSLTDWFKRLRSPRQIRATLESLGLREIWCASGGNGVEARGKRPSAQ